MPQIVHMQNADFLTFAVSPATRRNVAAELGCDSLQAEHASATSACTLLNVPSL